MKKIVFLLVLLFISACAVGPNYQCPMIEVPEAFKETPKGWKVAEPKDNCDPGAWWNIFKDPRLNALEEKVNVSNQSIKAAFAQYQLAQAMAEQAFAAYYPTLGATSTATRQKSANSGLSATRSNTTGTGGTSSTTANGTLTTIAASTSATPTNTSSGPTSNYSIALNASWVPDLWGSVRRNVESNNAAADASAAQLAGTRLSMQSSLAQLYFQVRMLDANQKLLDDTVVAYKKALQITKNRYATGVAARLDVLQAETQLETAEVQAKDNGISRSQFEHAIAVLIAQPASTFCLSTCPLTETPPSIPVQVPSSLLERRPDIGQAERLAAQANAQIGVAISAYFPSLTLSGAGGYSNNALSHLISVPNSFWALGAQLADLIFDGGLRSAQVDAARATFDQTVANYRQTVLAAFQNVEDNLVALRILKEEAVLQKEAVKNAEWALKITFNQYISGTQAYSQVIIAQTTVLTAKMALIAIQGRRMTSTVGLIASLGGGWDVCP